MEQAKHTPGPWHTGTFNELQSTIIYREDGYAVADAKVFHGRTSIAEAQANARLIAKAPELLEALQNLLALYQKTDRETTDEEIEAEYVIAKAVGAA